MPEVSLIVAVAQNGVIGREGDMPWRLSTDLKRFKSITLGKPVVMGRKTYDSIGKPLPGRFNIVISRSPLEIDGVNCVTSLDQALQQASDWANENDATELFVIGGGQIYGEALARASRLYVTHVLASPEGDTCFPDIKDSDWRPVQSEKVIASENDNMETLFVIYERRK